MDNIPTQLLVPIGVITAALIAGFFSFLNLVISKEQKVSEFRQAWIDKLREDLCRYVASIRYIASANEIWITQGRPDPLKYYEAMRPPVDAASQAYHSMVLRINPADSNKKMKTANDSFLAGLNTVRDHVDKDEYGDARTIAGTLSTKLQPILKYEWERVKKGETIYRFTRAVAILIVIAALVAGAYFAYRGYVSMPVQVMAPANQPMKPTH